MNSSLALRLSVAANVVFALLGAALVVRRLSLARDDGGARRHAEERATLFAALPPREGGTVLLGDSLTERGEWAELLGDAAVRNRGVAGDTTRDVLARAPAVAAARPERVFLLAGVNDLEAGEPVASIAERYGAILDALRAGAPGARLFCQSVFPVREGLAPRPLTNAKIAALNEALARAAAGRGCAWVDVGAALADGGGALDARFTLDGVHLTGPGYAAWARVIAPWASAPR